MKRLSIKFLLLSIIVLFVSCVENSLVDDEINQEKIINNSNQSNKIGSDKSLEHVQELLSKSFLPWWQAIHVNGNSFNPQVMADAATSSWGNYGMRELSSEPRTEFDNTLENKYADYPSQVIWNLYSTISAMVEVNTYIILDGNKIVNDSLTTRAKAFSSFLLGISYGSLATIFDKALFFDEKTDFSVQLEMKNYSEIHDISIGYLNKVIAITDTANFGIPLEWFKIDNYTSDSLAALTHSFIARYKSSIGRTPTERNNVNWVDVNSHAEKGITFAPMGDGEYWWSRTQYYAGVSASWGRADYKLIGPSDKSSGYKDWLETPVADRAAFSIDTDDKRITGELDSDGKQTQGLYAKNEYRTRLIASRGTYHQTNYVFNRTRDYAVDAGLQGPMHDMTQSELDLLQAEAALRAGDASTAATLINKTRLTNGGLAAATATDDIGSSTDQPNALTTGTLWAKYKYEAILENCFMHPYSVYTLKRGWGDLVKGTLTMFPTPASMLEYMLLDYYTFGGVDNAGKPGTAGKTKFIFGEPIIKPRLNRFQYKIDKLK